jgi:hypothetical protein
MQAVVCEARAGGLLELADEFVEDPGCVMMVAGADDNGLMLFTLWQDGLAEEVADGLVRHPSVDVVRVLTIPEGAAFWT